MNKLFAMFMAVMLMLSVAAVTVYAEGTENLVEDYEIVEEDTEIVDDEVEAPKPAVTVAKPAESAPKNEDKKPVETKPAVPSIPEKEDEISKPQIIPEDTLPIIGVIGVVAVGGLRFYYFKFIKGKKKDDMDFYDDEGYEEHYVNEDENPDSGGEDAEDSDEDE